MFKVLIERTLLQTVEIAVAAEDRATAEAMARGIYAKHRGSLTWSPKQIVGIGYSVALRPEDEEVVEGEEIWF